MRGFYDLSLTIIDHRRLLDGLLTDEEPAAGVAHLDTKLGELRQALARNRFDHDAADLATAIVLKRHGLTRDQLGTGEENQVRQAFRRASIDLVRNLRARYDGDFTYEPKDRLLNTQATTGLTLSIGSLPASNAAPAIAEPRLQPSAPALTSLPAVEA